MIVKLIVGQDPYPNMAEQLKVENYPFEIVGFIPKKISEKRTFKRVLGIVVGKGKAKSIFGLWENSKISSINLANFFKSKNIYFCNCRYFIGKPKNKKYDCEKVKKELEQFLKDNEDNTIEVLFLKNL